MESRSFERLSFFVGIDDCVRVCLQPSYDFQIHFIYKLPYSVSGSLKWAYIDQYGVFRATK